MDISTADLADLIAKEPSNLQPSLDKTMKPVISFLKSLSLTQTQIITLLKYSPRIFRRHPQRRLAPNIALLQTHDVSVHIIQRFIITGASALVTDHDAFKDIVGKTKKLNMDPSRHVFFRAIIVFSCLTKSSLEAKFEIYKRWGLSQTEIHALFRLQPICMTLSENNIMGTMEYLVNTMGFDPSAIAKHPSMLLCSLEKRIIPRFSVIQLLITKGLVDKHINVLSVLSVSNVKFMEKFVTKFEKEVPQLLDTYQGKMECSGILSNGATLTWKGT